MNINLIALANDLRLKLEAAGIPFNSSGYPIVPADMLIKELPAEIVPFGHRKSCRYPERTILCFFSKDELLYRRLRKLDEDNELCREYMGVCGFDLSPCIGYDKKLQEFNLLLNQLVNAYRIINGVKVLPNFRIGDLDTLSSLLSYPAGTWYAAGTLGCARGWVDENIYLLKAKLLYARPGHLLIYGPLRNEYAEILKETGQDYTVFNDYQRVSRAKNRDQALHG